MCKHKGLPKVRFVATRLDLTDGIPMDAPVVDYGSYGPEDIKGNRAWRRIAVHGKTMQDVANYCEHEGLQMEPTGDAHYWGGQYRHEVALC